MKNYPLFFSLRLGTDDGKIIAFGDVSPQKNNSVNKSINVNLYNATHYNILRADLNMVTRLRFELRTTRFGERDES